MQMVSRIDTAGLPLPLFTLSTRWCDMENYNAYICGNSPYGDTPSCQCFEDCCPHKTRRGDNLPRPTEPYRLAGLAAQRLATVLTRADFMQLPEELHSMVQMYTKWPRQVGVFEAIRAWHPDGRQSRETHVMQIETASGRQWVRHGIDASWSVHTGNLLHRHEYIQGRLHGRYQSWLSNGRRIADKTYVDGTLDGMQKWWPIGNPHGTEAEYRMGKQIGVYREYYGKRLMREHTKNVEGQVHGVFRSWSQQGYLFDYWKYENGKRVMRVDLYPRGWPHRETQIVRYMGHACVTHYHSDGTIVSETEVRPIRTGWLNPNMCTTPDIPWKDYVILYGTPDACVFSSTEAQLDSIRLVRVDDAWRLLIDPPTDDAPDDVVDDTTNNSPAGNASVLDPRAGKWIINTDER